MTEGVVTGWFHQIVVEMFLIRPLVSVPYCACWLDGTRPLVKGNEDAGWLRGWSRAQILVNAHAPIKDGTVFS